MHFSKSLLMAACLLLASTAICSSEDSSSEVQTDSDVTDSDVTDSEKSVNESDSDQQSVANSIAKTDSYNSIDFLICHQCSCPHPKMENPYTIDCRSMGLEAVPEWDKSLNDIDNIHLDLSSNNFYSVPPFSHNSYIDALYFNFNNIDMVTANAFSELPHLKRLHLYGNHLIEIHKSAFCGKNNSNSHLEVLDLSENFLSSFDDDLFQCTPDLRHLILSKNQFLSFNATTQTAFNSLKYLELLDLSENGITELPIGLTNPICHLTTFNLARNNFKQVPDVLQEADKLKYLNLDQNPIEILDALSFEGMKNLKNLSISGMMSLVVIKTGTFQSLHNLEALNCNENPKLTTIEAYAFGSAIGHGSNYLEILELRNNSLTHLDEAVFNGTHIHIMDIRNNPLNCSCEAFWIAAKTYYYGTSRFLNETICTAPAHFSGISIDKVNFQGELLFCPDLQHEGKPPKMPSTYTFLLVMVIIATFLMLFFIGYIVVHKVKFNKYQTLQIPGTSKHTFKPNKFNDAFDMNGEEMEVYSR